MKQCARKSMARVLGVLLAVAMLFSMAPLAGAAEDGAVSAPEVLAGGKVAADLPEGLTFVDDYDSSIRYSGWTAQKESGRTDECLEKTRHYVDGGTGSQSITFSFTGSSLYIISKMDASGFAGTFTVAVDGSEPQEVNLDSSEDVWQSVVWEDDALEETSHTVVITAKSGWVEFDGYYYQGVVIPAEGVELNEESVELYSNFSPSTVQLTATLTPEGATSEPITWSSDDDTVATVDQSGLVRAVADGSATITAATESGLKATCAVTVSSKDFTSQTYYIDATEGDDSNDGLSPETAWQSIEKVNATTFVPGDRILFQCGEEWTGELWPKGSGTEAAPIVIASYGEGAKPLLMPGEDRTLAHFEVANDVLRNRQINNGITFYNQEHWEVRDLELYDPNFEDNFNDNYDTTYGVYRRAINLMAEDAGDLYGFTIDNVTMHGFRGPASNRGKSSGGVIITIITSENPSERVPTAINDITVTNCEMYNLGRSGFNFSSPWTTRQDSASHGDEWGQFGYAGLGDWYPCKNIYIANNIIHDIDGDGVLIDGCENVLVENNTVYRTCMNAQMAVGMFNWNSDYTVFQYNEVYEIRPADSHQKGGYDAQGIEIDALNRDTLVQYNYMHDNLGGTFMWCDTNDLRGFRGIYRYNIAQGDGNKFGVIDWRPNHVDSGVYNNTIYISGTDYVKFLSTNNRDVASAKVYNNIFYNTNENLDTSTFLESQIDWKNNIFYGFDNVPADESNIQADPLLVAPGTGATGMDTVNGYKLQENSPAIDAGVTVEIPAIWEELKPVFKAAFGSEIGDDRDYFGTALTDGKTDIGAAEYAAEVLIPSYAISVEKAEHGTVKSNRLYAAQGATVTLTVTPEDGYTLDTLTVQKKDGSALSLTALEHGTYTFKMPAAKVTVTASFKAVDEAQPDSPFTDVDSGAWYAAAVDYVTANDIMNGTSSTTFAPTMTLTRSMMAQILYNLAQKPAVAEGNPFTDVPADQWYSDAVTWAAANDIVNGYGGAFQPDAPITREQMAAILYRYAQYKKEDVSASGSLDGFTDRAAVSDWAMTSMTWAVGEGILSGKGGGLLDPTGTATRAEVAQIMMNFLKV